MATPGVKSSFHELEGDKPLADRLHTAFRGSAARSNYLAADRLDAQFAPNAPGKRSRGSADSSVESPGWCTHTRSRPSLAWMCTPTQTRPDVRRPGKVPQEVAFC